MQTSLTSRTYSSSGKETNRATRGFTLVELLISIAIIGTVTSLVLAKYGSFDSTVLLKGLAYEIALTLREAQVRSVSVARDFGTGEVGNFDYPFGVTFSLTSPKRYTSFRYENSNPLSSNYYPKYDADNDGDRDDPAKDIRAFVIPRTMKVQDLCVNTGGANDICGIDQLDVSFRRPKFKGLFHAVDGATEYTTTVMSATIEVGSENGFNAFIIKVTSLGQISVYKKP